MSTQRKANRQANVELFILKEDDETRAASISMVEDEELAFHVVAGGVYRFEVFVRFQASHADVLGLDVTMTGPDGFGIFYTGGADGTQPQSEAFSTAFGAPAEDGSDRSTRSITGFYGIAEPDVEGDVVFVWGSNVAAPGQTMTVKKGSYIKVQRLV